MKCSKCQSDISQDDRFCRGCGEKLDVGTKKDTSSIGV